MNPNKGLSRTAFFLALAGVGASAAWFAVLQAKPERLQWYLSDSVLLAALSLLTAFVALLWFALQKVDAEIWRQRLLDAGIGVGIAAIICFNTPAVLTLEMDESLMHATAQSIVQVGSPMSVTEAYLQTDGKFSAEVLNLDKRGVQFPLTLAIVNTLLGDTPWNAVLLNSAYLTGILFLVLRLSRRLFETPLALMVLFAFAAYPTLWFTLRTGLLDGANVFWSLLSIHLFLGAMQNGSPRHLVLTVVCCCVAGQIRQEQILLGATMIGWLSLRALRAEPDSARTWFLASAPWWLIPAALRAAVPSEDQVLPGVTEAWSLHNLYTNFLQLMDYSALNQPLQWGHFIFNPLGLIGLMLTLIALPRLLRGEESKFKLFGLWLSLIAVLYLVVLTFYWGQARLAMTQRIFLLWALTLCLSAGFLLNSVEWRRPWIAKSFAALAALYLLGSTYYFHGNSFGSSIGATNRDLLLDELDQTKLSCRVLVVSTMSVSFVVRGQSAISPMMLRKLQASAEGQRRLAHLHVLKLDMISEEVLEAQDMALPATLEPCPSPRSAPQFAPYERGVLKTWDPRTYSQPRFE